MSAEPSHTSPLDHAAADDSVVGCPERTIGHACSERGTAAAGEELEADDHASELVAIIARQVRLFNQAWEAAVEPPRLADFLPDADSDARRLVLVELAKVDLGRRWPMPKARWLVEQYLAAFEELASDGQVPYDLVLEEYQVRRQLGDEVPVEQYLKRFPEHATQLGRLLADADRAPTTMVTVEVKADELDAGQQIDDFDLLIAIGRGAFAKVFLARQRSMQRLVAVKVSADRGNEPQTMAQLDHPHIVRVFDQRLIAGRNLRLLYMQYVAGGTLQAVIQQARKCPAGERTGALLFAAMDESLAARGESAATDSPLRMALAERSWPEVVCWLGARLASALDYAHRRGVLHRDLKPANVLVSADGSPKLADFNISFCSKIEGATPAAYFGGSLPYMSPEQLEAFNPLHDRSASDIDERSDLYSLGVVLWELLAAERPFKDPPVRSGWNRALEEMVVRRRAPLTAQLPKNLPAGLAESLARCLAAEPNDRFQTAGQLARQMELCLRPGAQRLLFSRGAWRRWAQRFSLFTLLLAGLVPNVVASALSIAYNQTAIVSQLGRDAQRVFNLQLVVINPIAYSVAVVWLLRLAWPVIVGLYRRERKQPQSVEQRSLERSRCLRIGEYVAWVTAATWTVCGFVFPIWMRLDAQTTDAMTQARYASFFTALIVCGLIAATLSFFLVTFVAVRALYPRLADTDVNDSAAGREVAGLARRSGFYFLLAVSVPFIAVLAAMILLPADDRGAVIGLAVIGLVAFFASYALWRQIQHDLEALEVLLSPASSLSDSSSILSDSSWASRR